MDWNSFVLIALAIFSSLAPNEILATQLADEFDEKELNDNLILRNWHGDNSEEALGSKNALNDDKVFGFEKKQTAYTQDLKVFVHPEKQQYSSEDAERDAEKLLFPSDDEHYSSEEHSRESRECPYRRKMLEAMKRRSKSNRWVYYDDYRNKRSPHGRLNEENESWPRPEHSIDSTNAALVKDKVSDTLERTKRDVEKDNTAVNVNQCCHQNKEDQRVFKRSARLSEHDRQSDQSSGIIKQKEDVIDRKKRSVESDKTIDQVRVDNQKVAKRSTHVSEGLQAKSKIEVIKVSKRSTDTGDNFLKEFGKAVDVCCKNRDIEKIYDNARAFAKFEQEKSQEGSSKNAYSSIVRSAGMSGGPQGHRLQKRRINLVMNDPSFIDLGLNPKQIADCVNEMLAVPGFTEQGLNWQILGDHWRHFFILMKDLQESYSLGLFAAIRELTNFHRWMHMNLIQRPYASGPFSAYYYKRRHELNQPSIWNYAEKPVFGRVGAYWNHQEYVPKWEPWYVKDYSSLTECDVGHIEE